MGGKTLSDVSSVSARKSPLDFPATYPSILQGRLYFILRVVKSKAELT